jgi:hypothetical protein
MLKPTRKTQPSRLQAVLDQEIGFENRIDSRIVNIKRGYDDKTGEYVIWLEYRTRVRPGTIKKNPPSKRYPLMQQVNSGLAKP